MPQMGYDMKEGTLVRWLKSEGDPVEVGDPIAEIETDKAVVEFESTTNGVLRKALVPEGKTVAVGQPIAIVGEADEDIPNTPTHTKNREPEKPPVRENKKNLASSTLDQPTEVNVSTPNPGVKASPVARRIAREKGVDLSQVTGTGPNDRITKEDILNYLPSHGKEAVSPEPPPTLTSESLPNEKLPLTRMRQQIARVTIQSKQETPHFYVSTEIDMTQAVEVRRQINTDLEKQGSRVTVNDMVIKACVGALKVYPKFNAAFVEDGVQMNEKINIGIAISEDQGLVVPAIMDCASKSLASIAAATKDLIERSKHGTLRPQEYTGGTFSISNMGMFDVSSFIAIILPPQSAMLAVGAIDKTPVVRNNQITTADILTATLSVDHRVSDGAEGAQFLVEVKRLLQNPASLLL